jgi:polysaccharide pyruvyl transferase WcaK-like protein
MRVAILGPFGLGNLGDAAIQDAMVANIRRRDANAEIVGISLDPADTSRRHGIASFPISPGRSPVGESLGARFRREAAFAKRALSLLRNLDLVIVSGGGQLDDAWGGARAQPLNLLRWSVLAKIAGVRMIYVSVGAGPLFSHWSKRLHRVGLSLASYRSYRDAESRDLIESIGVRKPGLVYPDLAFSLPRTSPSWAERDRPLIGIGPMPHRDPRMSPLPGPDPLLYATYVRKLAEFVTWLIEEARAIPVFYVGEISQDPPVIRDVIAALGSGPSLREGVDYLVPAIESVGDLMGCLESLDLVVASRFHGVLLPLSLGVPAIALSYHPKVTALMNTTGLAEYCFDIDCFTADDVRRAYGRLRENGAAVRGALEELSGDYLESLKQQYDAVFAHRY